MHVIECTHIHVGCLRVCVACRKWTLWRETRFVTHVLQVAMISGCACMHVSLHALTQWGEFKQIEETQSEKLEKFLDELEDSEDDSEDSDYSDDGDDGEDDESDDPESGDLEKDFEDLEESDEDTADQWKKKKCRKRRLTITNWVSETVHGSNIFIIKIFIINNNSYYQLANCVLTCIALRLCLEFLIKRCNVVDSTTNTTVSENVDVINFLYACIPYIFIKRFLKRNLTHVGMVQ